MRPHEFPRIRKKSIRGDSGDSWPVWNRGIMSKVILLLPRIQERVAAVRSKVVVLLLLTFCLLLLPLWESVIVLCFGVRYFMSILVLQLP